MNKKLLETSAKIKPYSIIDGRPASQGNASGWEVRCVYIAPTPDSLFTLPRVSGLDAQTSWNHLCERASPAVSLFAGSKFVRPPMRSLRSESSSSLFHRTKGSRGFSLLKPSRSAFSTWHHGLSPRCLNNPSRLFRSAKYEIWRSSIWASATSPSGSASSSTYKITCFSTAYIHYFTISAAIRALRESRQSNIQLTTMPKENMSEGLLTRPSAWASGLRQFWLPTCLPRILLPGGTYAESSRSPRRTSSMMIPWLFWLHWTKILFGLMSMAS